MTLIHAQTPVFPQTSRIGLVLGIATADQWDILTLAVDILVSILQREESFSAFWEIHASKLETGIQS